MAGLASVCSCRWLMKQASEARFAALRRDTGLVISAASPL